MIAALRRAAAATGRLIEAAVNARTLARTVRILARQLDNAHLLAASEEARADRAELRVAELEHQLEDWAELSGELAAEQPTDDALPDLTDAGEAPIPIELPPDAYRERDRADRLQAMLQACEVELATARAQIQQTERAAGAHIATIEALREELADALRDAAEARDLARRAIFTQEQPLKCRECGGLCEEDRRCYARPTCHRCLPPPPALKVFQIGAPAEQIPGVAAAPHRHFAGCAAQFFDGACDCDARHDDPPPTRPSERTTATREEPRP